jgi:hypothetical protein
MSELLAALDAFVQERRRCLPPLLIDLFQRYADVWRDGRRGRGAGGAPAGDCLVRTRSKKPQSIHLIQLQVAGANGRSQNIVSKRYDDIEVLVRVLVMQVMVPAKKLVDWPIAKEALFGLVHL